MEARKRRKALTGAAAALSLVMTLSLLAGCGAASMQQSPPPETKSSLLRLEAPHERRACTTSEFAALSALVRGAQFQAISAILEGRSGYEFAPKIFDVPREQYLCWFRGLQHVDLTNEAAREQVRCIDGDSLQERVPGATDRNSSPLVSGYFTPVFHGSSQRSERHSAALRAAPRDLVHLDLERFGLPAHERPLRGFVRDGVLLPYPSRAEINRATVTPDQVLAWLDPVDLFHAQTQGSAVVAFSDGTRRSFEFADRNGHTYLAIGAELPIKPPLSWQKIEEYLRALPRDELLQTLERNPSYIFFRESDVVARTASGAPAIPEVSIAIDRAVYPFASIAALRIEGREHGVVAHDIGSAIRGPNRIDWYLGVGELAGARAGALRERGTLTFFVPTSSMSCGEMRENG